MLETCLSFQTGLQRSFDLYGYNLYISQETL